MAERRRGLGRGIGALIPSAQRESKDRPIDVFFGSGVASPSHESGKSPSSKQKKAKNSATPKAADDSKAEAAVGTAAKVEKASKKSPGNKHRPSGGGDASNMSSSFPLKEKSEATGKGKDGAGKKGADKRKDAAGRKDADKEKGTGGTKDADKGRSARRKTVVGGSAAVENSAIDSHADVGAKAVNADAKASGDFEDASAESKMDGKATSQDVDRPATQRSKRTNVAADAAPGSTAESAEATAKPVDTLVEGAEMKPSKLEPAKAIVESAGSKSVELKGLAEDGEVSSGNGEASSGNGEVSSGDGEVSSGNGGASTRDGGASTGDETREGLNHSQAAPFDDEIQTSPADSRGSEGMHPNSSVQHKTSVRAFDQAGAVEFSEEVPSVDVRQNKTKDSKSSASRDSSTSGTTENRGGQETADPAARPAVVGAEASSRGGASGEDGHSTRAEASTIRGDVGGAVDEDRSDKPELDEGDKSIQASGEPVEGGVGRAEVGDDSGVNESESGDVAESGSSGVAENVRLVESDGEAESGGSVQNGHVANNDETEVSDAVARGNNSDDVLAKDADRAQNEQDEADEGLVEVPGATYAELPLDQIIPNTRQPRNVFDEEELEELAASIREVGVLQPVIVRPLAAPIPGQPKARYELIMGERRWRASELAGIETVPAIIRHTQDEDLLRDALLENLHRAELNPLEEAAAYQQLLEDFQCTQEELSRRIVRSRPQISNTLRLLKLPPLVQRRVAAGVLSSGHARALLGLSDPGAMERLAQKIVSEGLSVRQVEEIVALGDEPTASPTGGRRRARRYGPELGELSSRLADRFDTRVKVEMGAKKGSIKIDFASIDDLNRILGVLSPGETGVDVAE